MKVRASLGLAVASVAVLAAVGLTAVAAGTSDSQLWLVYCVVFAVASAVQGVAADPRGLTAALLFSLPPVLALVADGSPTWLIGPLAVGLLLAGELNALSWEFQGEGGVRAARGRRLVRVAILSALGLAGAAAVGLASGFSLLDGTAAFALAALALVALGEVVFRRGRDRSRGEMTEGTS